MTGLKEFNSLIDLVRFFSTEEKCIEYLEQIRWNGNVVSPFDSSSKVYKCKNRYWCKNTNRFFNVKTRTIFENTKIPLQKWFISIWLIISNKKGISSLQLSRDINVTQKTSWFMLQRIRKCFEKENSSTLFNEVEIDETYIGGQERNKKSNSTGTKGTQGRSTKTKVPVLGMVERKGKLVSRIISDAKSTTLTPAILNVVDKTATIYTDEWKGYNMISKTYNHLSVKHKNKEFVHGRVYTNTIENFWGLLKRGILGIYHNTSKKHLQRYIDEFTFRYNTRNINDYERFDVLLSYINVRLKYRDL
ncbi:MAG: IS1595 family transposase [Bacteroidales bacterium]|nr:IS1595 family transposase [Bacteroidales bacterium]